MGKSLAVTGYHGVLSDPPAFFTCRSLTFLYGCIILQTLPHSLYSPPSTYTELLERPEPHQVPLMTWGIVGCSVSPQRARLVGGAVIALNQDFYSTFLVKMIVKWPSNVGSQTHSIGAFFFRHNGAAHGSE